MVRPSARSCPGWSIVRVAISTIAARTRTGRRVNGSIACRGSSQQGMLRILVRVWPYCPTLPTPTASAVRAGVPQRDEAAIRELGGNHGDKAGRLKGGSAAITSRKYLQLPGDTIIPNNLTMPLTQFLAQHAAR